MEKAAANSLPGVPLRALARAHENDRCNIRPITAWPLNCRMASEPCRYHKTRQWKLVRRWRTQRASGNHGDASSTRIDAGGVSAASSSRVVIRYHAGPRAALGVRPVDTMQRGRDPV